jgi:WD40 repeat protein/transcriptional regulator with XRE-family HTH domain
LPDNRGVPRAPLSASEHFSGLLLHFRGRTALTQRELAARVGASRRVIQDWEAGVNVPSADHLQALIAVLFGAGGLSAGSEAVEARKLWTAALNESSSRMRRELDEDWLARVLTLRPADDGTVEQLASAGGEIRRQDWGEAPDVVGFVGRASELETCRAWLVHDTCHLLTLLGVGGIGKTTFAARLAEELVPDFQCVYWRSLRDAVPTTEWLADAIGFLSDHQLIPPPSEMARVTMLLELLREHRNLLVLDNFETLLEPRQQDASYRVDSAGYGRVLRALGEGRHQSCLLVTSREAPPELARLGGGAVRTLELGGLLPGDGQALLGQSQLTGNAQEWATLNARFGGNALALKIVGERIRQLFAGNIGAFLREDSGSGGAFGDIRRLLAEQIARGSALQQDVLRVLAVEREPVRLSQLLAALGPRAGSGAVLDSVEGLRRRSLVDRLDSDGSAAFTLQPVVLEYVTDSLVSAVSDEVVNGAPAQLRAYPLVKAQAKEYMRQTQERMIGAPILQLLRRQLGEAGTLQRLVTLLEGLRGRPPEEQGYTPGNVVNLLRLLRGGDLRTMDFSNLSIRQAYLAGVEAPGASLAGAHLIDAVLAEAFPPPFRVALSGDGTLMAVGTSTGQVWLFRVADRAPLLSIPAHTGSVWGVSLSTDGRLLATGSDDKMVRLWATATGRAVCAMEGHTNAVRGVALSADGRLLASGSADGTVRLWEVPSGRPLQTLHGHTGTVASVSLSDDGGLVASGGDDGTVRLWETATGNELATLRGHGSAVWGVALSANGRVVASGGVDGSLKVWEVPCGRALATLQGHTSAVWGVALSGDGRLLASCSADCTIRLWEAHGGRAVAILQGHTSMVMGVAVSQDGRLLASSSADGAVRLWEVPGGQMLATLQGHTRAVFSVTLSQDGRLLASGHGDGTARLWEVASGRSVASLRGHTSAIRVILSTDSRVLATGGADCTVRLWDVESGRVLATLVGHTSAVIDVALSADGQLLASGGADGKAQLWEVPSGHSLTTFEGHTNAVRAVALSVDSRLLASGGADGTVRLWEIPSGRSVATLEGHSGGVWSVALVANGRLLASGSADATVRLWEVPRGRLVATLHGHTSTVMRVAVSADGRLLASGSADGNVRLWELPSGRPLGVMQGHTSAVFGVALSVDGRLAASGSGDGTIKLWETADGTCVGTLQHEPCYERMDITGMTGVTVAQHAALLALGAVEHPTPLGETVDGCPHP